MVVIAAVLVVIGVGGSSSNPTVPSSTVTDAAAATAKLPGYRTAISGSVTSSKLGRTLPMHGSGVVDTRGRTGSMTLTLAGLPTAPGGMRIDEVISNYVVYMRSPAFSGKLPGGKSWLKLDLRKASQAEFGIDPTDVTSDPTKALDQLRAVSGRVQKLGTEDVRGVRTTHYRADVNLRRYPNLLPPARRAAARRGVAKLIATIGRSKIPQDVWIDAQKHIRRFLLQLQFHVPSTPGDPKVNMTLDEQLYEFGTRVPVQVPPDSDSFDATKLAQRPTQSAFGAQ